MTNRSNPQKRGGDLMSFVGWGFVFAIFLVMVWNFIFGP